MVQFPGVRPQRHVSPEGLYTTASATPPHSLTHSPRLHRKTLPSSASQPAQPNHPQHARPPHSSHNCSLHRSFSSPPSVTLKLYFLTPRIPYHQSPNVYFSFIRPAVPLVVIFRYRADAVITYTALSSACLPSSWSRIIYTVLTKHRRKHYQPSRKHYQCLSSPRSVSKSKVRPWVRQYLF